MRCRGSGVDPYRFVRDVRDDPEESLAMCLLRVQVRAAIGRTPKTSSTDGWADYHGKADPRMHFRSDLYTHTVLAVPLTDETLTLTTHRWAPDVCEVSLCYTGRLQREIDRDERFRAPCEEDDASSEQWPAIQAWWTNGFKRADFADEKAYRRALGWIYPNSFENVPRVKRACPMLLRRFHSSTDAEDAICEELRRIVHALFTARLAARNLKDAFSNPARPLVRKRIEATFLQ